MNDAYELIPFKEVFYYVCNFGRFNVEIWHTVDLFEVTVVRLCDGAIFDNISDYLQDLINKKIRV